MLTYETITNISEWIETRIKCYITLQIYGNSTIQCETFYITKSVYYKAY